MRDSKRKFVVFVILFLLAQFLTWLVSHVIIDTDNQYDIAKKMLINFGVGIGVTLTLFMSYLWVESARVSERVANYSRPVVASYIFSLLALPFGLIVGIIGGGTLGGAWMSVLFEWLGISREVGLALGIGLGIFIGSMILVLPATMIGFSLGLRKKG